MTLKIHSVYYWMYVGVDGQGETGSKNLNLGGQHTTTSNAVCQPFNLKTNVSTFSPVWGNQRWPAWVCCTPLSLVVLAVRQSRPLVERPAFSLLQLPTNQSIRQARHAATEERKSCEVSKKRPSISLSEVDKLYLFTHTPTCLWQSIVIDDDVAPKC